MKRFICFVTRRHRWDLLGYCCRCHAERPLTITMPPPPGAIGWKIH